MGNIYRDFVQYSTQKKVLPTSYLVAITEVENCMSDVVVSGSAPYTT